MEKQLLKSYIHKLEERMKTADEDMPYYANELCNVCFLVQIEWFLKVFMSVGIAFVIVKTFRKLFGGGFKNG